MTDAADFLSSFTRRQLTFDYLALDVLRRMIDERVRMRDRHHANIMCQISDVSGDLYGCHIAKSPENARRKSALEKTKIDLERQLREEDITLWRDLIELRQVMVGADRQYTMAGLRHGMLNDPAPQDDHKDETHPMDSGHLPGA